MPSRSTFKFASLIAGLCVVTLSGVSPSMAHDAGSLTIYTYDAFAADWGPGPKVKAAFEEDCHCKLNFVAADSSIGALRKVQLEGANTKADIVLGLDTNIAEAARMTGLFTEHNISFGVGAFKLHFSQCAD